MVRFNGWSYVAVNRDTGVRVAAGPTAASVMSALENQQEGTDDA